MDAQSLLTLWERGRYRHTLDRGLLLHAFATPGEDANTLADRTLGERNIALLRLRQSWSGDELQSSIDCPGCGERLEFALSAAALLTLASTAPASDVLVGNVLVRVPTTRDIASIAGEGDDESAATKLFERLVRTSTSDGVDLELGLSDELTRALNQADPCADIAIDCTCPGCGHAWNASFDVAAFVWEEVDVRARRLLDEVHVLALAYGWSEPEILALADTRRRSYIERVLA
jgi:hypothetical protein